MISPRRETLERALIRLTREEVRKSPRLLDEYKRRHRWDWLRRSAVFVLTPILVLTALVLMPVSFTAALNFPLVMRFLPNPDRFAQFLPTLALLLGGQCACLGGIVCFLVAKQASTFCQHSELFAATYLPVSDRELLRRNLKAWVGPTGLPYLGYVLGMVTISAVIVVRPSIPQSLALAVAIPLNVWHVMALAITAFALVRQIRWPRVFWPLLGMSCLFSIWAIPFLGLLPQGWQELIGTLLMVLPSGWVNGAIYYVAIEPSFWGLGFLLPLAATWYWAARWLWRGYAIREILISPFELTPVFDRGFINPRAIEALYKPTPVATALSPNGFAVAPVPRTSAELEEEAKSLLSNSWRSRGWVERLASRFLTPRERTIIEHVFRGHVRWTTAYYVGISMCVCLFVVLLPIAVFAPDPIEGRRGVLPLEWSALICFVLCYLLGDLTGSLPFRSTTNRPGYPPLHPIQPIGWRECRRLYRKMLWLRMLLWMPILMVAAAGLQAVRNPALIPVSCLAVVSALVTTFVFLETVGCLLFMNGVIETLSWSRILRIMFLVPLGLLPIPALFIMATSLVGPPWLATFAPFGWLLIFLSGFAVQKYAEWTYHRTELDFACGETIAPDPRRRR